MNANGGELGFSTGGRGVCHRKEFIRTSTGKNDLALLSVTYTSHSCKIVSIGSESDHGEGCAIDQAQFSTETHCSLPGGLERLPGTALKSSCLLTLALAAAFYVSLRLWLYSQSEPCSKTPFPQQNSFVTENYSGIQTYFSEHLE